jgi:hypothetical protein
MLDSGNGHEASLTAPVQRTPRHASPAAGGIYFSSFRLPAPMRNSAILSLTLVAALAGCERQSQALPFSAEVATATQVINPAGGTVSTAAGASVEFPAGSLQGSTAVTLTTVAAPAQQSGSPISTAFKLEPSGTVLAQPANVELRFDAKDASRAWLASVINVTANGVQEVAETRVDASTGIVEAQIQQLGTLAVVLPDPAAVFTVQSAGVAADRVPEVRTNTAAAAIRGLRSRCGEAGNRCAGLKISASDNILSQVGAVALLYPSIRAEMKIDNGLASGSVLLDSSVRIRLKGAKVSENVAIHAELTPTSATRVTETTSSLTLSNLRVRVSGRAQGVSEAVETIRDVTIPKQTGNGVLSITRSFDFRNSGGRLEPASFTVNLPLELLK